MRPRIASARQRPRAPASAESRPRARDRARSTWALIALFALAAPAQGADRRDLHDALVDVRDDSAQARIDAIPRALDQVFTKLSGRRPAGPSSARQDELAQAALAVVQYGYRLTPTGEPTRLFVRFDEQAVIEAARRAGVQPWLGPRPSPLLWVAVKSDGAVELVGTESAETLTNAVLDAAWRRGLTVHLPLLDLEDRLRVTPESVWQGDVEALMAGSERYPAGPVVGARVERAEDGSWRADWLMVDGGKTSRWSSQAAGPASALDAGVDAVADLIAARHAPGARPARPDESVVRDAPASDGPAPGETVEMIVHGVRSGGEYGRLMAYLRQLDGVRRFSIMPGDSPAARFRLEVAGGESHLLDMIREGDVLEPTGDDNEFRMRY